MKTVVQLGLDYSRKPYRNYYYCSAPNDEWGRLMELQDQEEN